MLVSRWIDTQSIGFPLEDALCYPAEFQLPVHCHSNEVLLFIHQVLEAYSRDNKFQHIFEKTRRDVVMRE